MASFTLVVPALVGLVAVVLLVLGLLNVHRVTQHFSVHESPWKIWAVGPAPAVRLVRLSIVTNPSAGEVRDGTRRSLWPSNYCHSSASPIAPHQVPRRSCGASASGSVTSR